MMYAISLSLAPFSRMYKWILGTDRSVSFLVTTPSRSSWAFPPLVVHRTRRRINKLVAGSGKITMKLGRIRKFEVVFSIFMRSLSSVKSLLPSRSFRCSFVNWVSVVDPRLVNTKFKDQNIHKTKQEAMKMIFLLSPKNI